MRIGSWNDIHNGLFNITNSTSMRILVIFRSIFLVMNHVKMIAH